MSRRRGAVLAVVEAVVEGFEDRQQGVQADQVGQGQRADRLVAAQAHAGVDVLGAGQAFLEHQDRLVDHRHQDAVDHKTRAVAGGDRGLAQALGHIHGQGVGRVAGLQPADHLDQAHHRHRVEEVQADEPLGRADAGCQLGDRQRRGVGGDHALGADLGGDLLQHLELEVEVLGGGFDHQLRILEHAVVGADADPAQGGELVVFAEGALAHLAVEVLADGGQGLFQGALGDVQQGHVKARLGADLGDAVAHGAGADHPDIRKIHLQLFLCSLPSRSMARLPCTARYPARV